MDDDIDVDDAVLGVTGKTLNRWLRRTCESLHAETGDEGWLDVTFHDLRRTWGTRLLECGVLPVVVMDWGGWHDWDTFREHYLGEFSPEALRRERGKGPVPRWGRGDRERPAEPLNPSWPVTTTALVTALLIEL